MSRFEGQRVESSYIAAKNTVSECQLFGVPSGTYYSSDLTFGSGTQPSIVLQTTNSNLLIRSVDRNVDFNASLRYVTDPQGPRNSDEVRISVKPESFPSPSGLPLAVVNENTPLPKFPTVEILKLNGHPPCMNVPLKARLLHSGDLALLMGFDDIPLTIGQLNSFGGEGQGQPLLIDVFGSYFSSAPIPY